MSEVEVDGPVMVDHTRETLIHDYALVFELMDDSDRESGHEYPAFERHLADFEESVRVEERAARASLEAALRAWEPFMRASSDGTACLQDEFGLFGCYGCDATSSGFQMGGDAPHRDPFYHDNDCTVELVMRALAGTSTPAQGEEQK